MPAPTYGSVDEIPDGPLKDFAVEVAAKHTKKPQSHGFDPVTILTLISMFAGLFKDCDLTPEQAARTAKRPSFKNRFLLQRACVKACRGKDKRLRAADDLCDDVIETAKNADPVALMAGYREAKSPETAGKYGVAA